MSGSSGRTPPRSRPPFGRGRGSASITADPRLNLPVVVGLSALLLLGGGILWALDVTRPPSVPVSPVDLFPTPIDHVITIFLENEPSEASVLDGPFEAHLAQQFATATNYHGLTGNSVADYFDATSGAFSGVVASVPQLVDRANESWAAYMESMPTPCDNRSSGLYDVAHDPFVNYRYVNSSQAYCDAHVQNLDAWNASLANGTLPNYVWVTPNNYDDGHNSSVEVSDRWLSLFLSPFFNSSLFRQSAVFITYDSNASSGGLASNGNGLVYFVAASPYARQGYASLSYDTHYNLLTTTEWLLGLGRTNHHDNWTTYFPMSDLFDFAPTYLVDGVVSAGGVAVAGAQVHGNGYTAITNTAGRYSFELSDGTFDLTATRPDGNCASDALVITVANGGATLNFALSC